MRVFYMLGNTGVGKTTLTSIIAYNLFLRNYQVGVLDLTDQGKGYFFRFGACDFFALGDGSINIPKSLLVTLQDISMLMQDSSKAGLHALPLMPGLKICLSAPAAREDKFPLAKLFIDKYQETFDFLFIEMEPPLQLLRHPDAGLQDRVMVICSGAQESWPGKDKQLLYEYAHRPRKVKVVLNKQKGELSAATKFVEANLIGVDYILPNAEKLLANSTVMEMCKYMSSDRFLKQLITLIYGIMLV